MGLWIDFSFFVEMPNPDRRESFRGLYIDSTPSHPGPEWRIFRMTPLRVSYRSMTSRFSPFAFVELAEFLGV